MSSDWIEILRQSLVAKNNYSSQNTRGGCKVAEVDFSLAKEMVCCHQGGTLVRLIHSRLFKGPNNAQLELKHIILSHQVNTSPSY